VFQKAALVQLGIHWVAAECAHVSLVVAAITHGVTVPRCDDALGVASDAYLGGVPAFDRSDSAADAEERLVS
jgi:hypothetical protein